MKIKKILFSLLTVCTLLLPAGCSTLNANGPLSGENLLQVHYIDVGQGDSVLVQLPDQKTMLIDGGDKSARDALLSYLKQKNVKKLDYCIATHPHADHIGSLDDALNTYELGQMYMPYASANTKAFEDLLNAVDKQGKTIETAKAGVVLFEEGNLKAEFLAPNSGSYTDINNYSAVLRLSYGDTSFLFTGDAEKESEEEILSAGKTLSCDVLKIGHHGSKTSSGKAFLKAANPKYAVISCGKDNSYQHPHQETLKKLKDQGIDYFQTDLNGTVTAVSDGTQISISAEKEGKDK